MLSDLIDEVIERRGGEILIGIGLLAIVLSAAGYYRLLPPPFSLPLKFDHVYGMSRLTQLSYYLFAGGSGLISSGVAVMAFFARERRLARPRRPGRIEGPPDSDIRTG